MHRWSATAAFLLVALFPFVARADDEDDEPMIVVEAPEPDPAPPPPEAPPAPIRRSPPRTVDVSYSSQTLLLDGVAIAMFVPGVAAKIDPLPGLGGAHVERERGDAPRCARRRRLHRPRARVRVRDDRRCVRAREGARARRARVHARRCEAAPRAARLRRPVLTAC